MRSIFAFLMAITALTTVALAEHPTEFALHVKNATGGNINVSSSFSIYWPSCTPATGPYGDVLGNGQVRTFECNTAAHYDKSRWAKMLTIMSGDRNHIYCNVQLMAKYDDGIHAEGGAGKHCFVSDHGTSVEILVR